MSTFSNHALIVAVAPILKEQQLRKDNLHTFAYRARVVSFRRRQSKIQICDQKNYIRFIICALYELSFPSFGIELLSVRRVFHEV
jgi:hypothetical protein